MAICANDAENYPEDSFDNMIEFAKKNQFTFPYLIDETQEIAKTYDAVCTPDTARVPLGSTTKSK